MMLSAQLLAAANQPTSGGWYDTVLYPFKWVTAWVLVGIHKGLTVLGVTGRPRGYLGTIHRGANHFCAATDYSAVY